MSQPKFNTNTIVLLVFLMIIILLIVIKITLAYPAEENKTIQKIDVYLFYGQGCPHCSKARTELGALYSDHPKVDLIEKEVYHSENNQKMFFEMAEQYGLNIGNLGVPTIFIGENSWIGFSNEIRDQIKIEVDYMLEYYSNNQIDNITNNTTLTNLINNTTLTNNSNDNSSNFSNNSDNSNNQNNQENNTEESDKNPYAKHESFGWIFLFVLAVIMVYVIIRVIRKKTRKTRGDLNA